MVTAAHCFCNQKKSFKCTNKNKDGRKKKWIPDYNFRTFTKVHFGIQAGQVGRVTLRQTRRLSKIIVHENYSVEGRH